MGGKFEIPADKQQLNKTERNNRKQYRV